MNLQEQIDFVVGPQVPISDSWLDQTLITKGRQHLDACPADPPTGDNELNSFILLHYYDLPLSGYIIHRRTGDPSDLQRARKAADSWWKHPTWIGEGGIRLWPDSAAPPPRHAGLGGLILRAIDGRPEMWPWIVGYTQAHMDIWCKSRINNAQLWYGPREVAFTLQFAAWVAVCLSDSFPNAAQIKAQLVADLENLVVNYTGRLQYPDGSWRDSSEWVDEDGGTMVNSMQPFIVGLLICALVDVHQVVPSTAAKESAKTQILKACRHLYSDGPYAKDLIEQKSGKRVRGFHYFYHGGTTVNPTKYEKGDMLPPWTDVEGWWLSSARQAISTILPSFGYAFKISGDQYYKDAAAELYDSAYGGGDGYRSFITDTSKNYNQHARRVGSLQAWMGSAVPLPAPQPSEPLPTEPPPTEPTPTIPVPTPTPEPKTPSPDGTKSATIVDKDGGTWTFGKDGETLRNGEWMGRGKGSIYKYYQGNVYVLGTDSNWYVWIANWNKVGVEPGGTVTPPAPEPVPEPPKPPDPIPPPVVKPARFLLWPKQQGKQNTLLSAQWLERYRHKATDGSTAEFVHEPE